jgi:hypothetical protein
MKFPIHGSFLVASLGLAALLTGADSSVAQDEDSYEAPERSVTLDAQTKARIGITTVAAKSLQYRAEAHGLGQVIGVDAIAQTDADLTVAEAAAQASQAALVRTRALFGADNSVSQQALEAAEHQAAADSAQLTLAERKSAATWGRDAPWQDAKRRKALIAKITAGTALIVRATFPADSVGDSALGSIRIERLDAEEGGKDWTATTVWSAPADPAVPGRSYYLLVEGAQGLAPGERVRVAAPYGAVTQGALVPTGAVLIAEGRTWLYIEEKADYFVRQAINLSHPVGEGYFTSSGVQPGEAVVIQGAGQLLAREIGTSED